MENIWGPQRKTGNMEEESLREENRKAHEEDERFRMTAVKAAGQVRQRMRCATGESDEVIRRKFMLPERYILTLMTVETLGQERMLLDLMAGGRLGADLVLCGRRSFYADMLLRTARDRRLALRTNFIYEYSPEELSAFFRMADGLVYLPRKWGRVQPVVEALYAGIPAVLSDTRRNRLPAMRPVISRVRSSMSWPIRSMRSCPIPGCVGRCRDAACVVWNDGKLPTITCGPRSDNTGAINRSIVARFGLNRYFCRSKNLIESFVILIGGQYNAG